MATLSSKLGIIRADIIFVRKLNLNSELPWNKQHAENQIVLITENRVAC
jgi:hypothetical protein